MVQYKGASRKHEIKSSRRRKDTRFFSEKLKDFFSSGDGVIFGVFMIPIIALILVKVPLSGELMLFVAWRYSKTYGRIDNQSFDFPYRVPKQANVLDGSTNKGSQKGAGVTLIGNDTETKEQIYAGDSDLRTHMLVLGTTGSGKTEFLLGLVFNALVQNTGFIYVDGKGDPNLQKQIFRQARYLGRECDLLLINFITSGRDFIEKQPDKVTNNMNIMGNTSSGMLIELIIALMDDSGGGGDMWKGRAISFVAALTRPLIYLRDKGYINLSPEKYLEYFELNILEDLVFGHAGKYGETFDIVAAPLRSYLVTLPGYQVKNRAKGQETKTLEQHGFIIMQLTRIFNDLTFNYGHIFKTKVGDVDFYDVVINRRLLVVLLPALERAPDSMRMLGKMIVGSIKQMMAGCLGNRVEGVVREIIDSRPTNAKFPFYTILDEYGYYAVIGFAVAPAQARSLGFSVIFAAQDFSSLKKSSAEEADATWENTNIRAVGRITSGQRSETWERIQGAAGESEEARINGFDRNSGGMSESFSQQDNVSIERRSRIEYDDLAMQQDGEFTFLVGKKENKGQSGGVRIIRGMGFYTAGPSPKEMRLNDLLPVESPEPSELPPNAENLKALTAALENNTFQAAITGAVKNDLVISALESVFNFNDKRDEPYSRQDIACIAMATRLSDSAAPLQQVTPEPAQAVTASLRQAAVSAVLFNVATQVVSEPRKTETAYANANLIKNADDDDEISINGSHVVTNIIISNNDIKSFRDLAAPLLRQHLYLLDDSPPEEEWEETLSVADTKMLLELEVVSSGAAFRSLEEKWETETRIVDTQRAIAITTSYIDAPTPAPLDLVAAQGKLDALALMCGQRVKDGLG